MTSLVTPAKVGVTPFDLPFKEIWLVDTEYNGGEVLGALRVVSVPKARKPVRLRPSRPTTRPTLGFLLAPSSGVLYNIWGWSSWARSFIKPPPGRGLAYCDWRQQEIAIAGKLSGDRIRMLDYQSGDTYTEFGKRVGLIPSGGTKETHKAERKVCKVCELSISYLQGPHGLGARLHKPPIFAKALLKQHRETYPVYWAWSAACLRFARWNGYISTRFGWILHTGAKTKTRTICNFQMQATGAHMMQLGVSLAVEAGLQVCAVIHDAILIEAPSIAWKPTLRNWQIACG